MPVVPFDPARARPRGQARPPKMPAPQTTAMPPRAPGTPAGAALPPGAVRPVSARCVGGRYGKGAGAGHDHDQRAAAAIAAAVVIRAGGRRGDAGARAAGAAAPGDQPLARRRHPIALHAGPGCRAVRLRGHHADGDGLGPAKGGLPTETPAAIVQLTNWLVSVPWLFVAVVLAASSRVERVVRPGAGPAWATLAFAAAACAAMQVVGRDLVSTWTLVTRAGLIVVATVSLSLAFRQFLAGPSKMVRAQIVRGVFAGLLGGLGPFAMLGRFAGVAGAATFAPIDALLSGADALVGLVLATVTIRATLVYVRDYMPDFNIALGSAAETPEPELSTAVR